MDPSTLSLLPVVVGLVAAVRSALPATGPFAGDGRLRVLILAIVAAAAALLLLGQPISVASLRSAVLLAAGALGGMTAIDRAGTAIGAAQAPSVQTVVQAAPAESSAKGGT